MLAMKARVHNGRLVLDTPTGLPEGTELDLVAIRADDDLDDEQREALHAALDEGLAQAEAGDTVEADDVLAQIGAPRP